MIATEGRPYCKKAQIYLVERGQGADLLSQCRSCEYIEYVGCPGFKFKRKENRHDPSFYWARWWYNNEPIPDNWDKEKFDPTIPDKNAHRVILPKKEKSEL